MALSEHRKSCGKLSGGVVLVALVPAEDVVRVTYNAATGRYTAIVLKPGTGFVRYGVVEDGAVYRERMVRTAGGPVVEHELLLTLKGMHAATRRSVMELAGAAGGVVVLVETRQGETLLAGYSQRFGTEQPLRLQRADGTTEAAPEKAPAETVRLTGRDTEKAGTFVGEIPWLA